MESTIINERNIYITAVNVIFDLALLCKYVAACSHMP